MNAYVWAGSAKMNLNPVLAQYLRGDDMKGIIFNQVAKTYGTNLF